MTKDVLITISGIHSMDEEDSDVEMMVRGNYYWKNGKHYIIYEEILDSVGGSIKNVIKVSDESMDIIKRGVTSTHMTFEKNKKNLSCYSTPLGDLIVGVRANRIKIDEQPDSLSVNVDYSLDINYRHLSECCMRVDVKSCLGA